MTRAAPPLAPGLARLAAFVRGVEELMTGRPDEARILRVGGDLLGALIAVDDWLPDAYARPDPSRYRQYLLHRDPLGRFSVVSFVWGPGQETPVHDHTVWGLVGVLRGSELSQAYAVSPGLLRAQGPVRRLTPGEVEAVSPRIGDVHRVSNAERDRASVSIHLYGADIGAVRRSTYDEAGQPKPFVSGYADLAPPDLRPFGIAA
jgi:predicted metal-dependent enzyme (double-stranded beta helix superfamily)